MLAEGRGSSLLPFRRILGYLDLYGVCFTLMSTNDDGIEISLVESDYTVVFFAAGSKYTPGWNWVWKAYRSLSRKYRKNLKRLVCIILSPSLTFRAYTILSISCTPRSFLKVMHYSHYPYNA
jgi:Divergent CRAL/TRIO domain